MNSLWCPKCQKPYSMENTAMQLKNCEHSLCWSCLQTEILCPLDKKRLDMRRYTLQAFDENFDVMRQVRQLANQPKTQQDLPKQIIPEEDENTNEIQTIHFVRMEPAIIKKQSQKREYQFCLLHSKSADLICLEDSCFICSNCALFGQHKKHSIISCDQFIKTLSQITDQSLNSFQLIKLKEEQLNQKCIELYAENLFKDKRANQLKNIKNNCARAIQIIRKVQRNAILQMDLLLKHKKQQLISEINFIEINQKKQEYFSSVEKLSTVMEDVCNLKNIEDGVAYVNEKSQKSYLLKNGEYLLLEMVSFQKMSKGKIEREVNQFQFIWNNELEIKLSQALCCLKAGDSELYLKIRESKSNLMSSKLRNNASCSSLLPSSTYQISTPTLLKSHEEDMLLGTEIKESQSTISPIHPLKEDDSRIEAQMIQSYNVQEKQNQPVRFLKMANLSTNSMNYTNTHAKKKHTYDVNRTLNPINNIQKKLVLETKRERLSKSRGKRDKSMPKCNNNTSYYATERQFLDVLCDSNPNGMKTKRKNEKKIEIPEKYSKIYEDLKSNKLETVDFGNAQLGDRTIFTLCEDFRKSSKLKIIKLMKNNLSDEILEELLYSCKNITSLNLSYNNFTEKSLDLLERMSSEEFGDLKNITLSKNKIVLRNVKSRLDDLKRKGLTVSL